MLNNIYLSRNLSSLSRMGSKGLRSAEKQEQRLVGAPSPYPVVRI